MNNNLKKAFYVLCIILLFVTSGLLGAYIAMQAEKTNKSNDVSSAFERYVSDDQNKLENLAYEVSDTKTTPTKIQENVSFVKTGVLTENPDRKVIKFTKELSNEEKSELQTKYSIKFTNDKSQNGVYVVESNSTTDIKGLEFSNLVSKVETDKPIKMFGQSIDWGVTRVGADQVWSNSSGTGTIVAVVDTGVSLTHSDLSSNIIAGYDFVNNDYSADDDNGHGTHVAGIVAAQNNGLGTVGVANSVRILPVKVLNSGGYGYLSDVAKGVYYAADHGARVINLSLGIDADSSILHDAITYASKKGVLIVAAAGNNSGAPCSYPAAYSEVICVVAIDQNNKLASFSNIGGELAAPGVSNLSTYLDNGYRSLSGTSMAAPHVSGSAAILMSYCKDCTTSEIRQLLDSTAVDLGTEGKDIIFGNGLVDVLEAYNVLANRLNPTPSITPSSSVTLTPTASATPKPTSDDKGSSKNHPTSSVTPTEKIKPTDAVKGPSSRQQKLVISEPEFDKSNRVEFDRVEDEIKFEFGLEPQLQDSKLRKITIFIDNEEVFSTTKQKDEYILKTDQLSRNQYVVRIITEYNDRSKSSETFIMDFTRTKNIRRTEKKDLRSILFGRGYTSLRGVV